MEETDRIREKIERVMKRLYSDKRMYADDMRDNAHLLNLALDEFEDIEEAMEKAYGD